ncbi:MAG: hypothetical protein RLZZ624_15 [Cyanobacteriota bacterium]|jgi:redox-sensitive bicupin YhaK (pirin superfamily)
MPELPTLSFRAAGERFLSRRDWLESWHSFSFGGHDDPAWRGYGPLRVINDDRLAAGSGFGLHPHHDMDIITVMVEGQLDHEDSLGHRGRLLAGDVQVMEAGRGIAHSEINGGQETCRLLQIWIEPAAAHAAPRYSQASQRIDRTWTPLVGPEGSGASLSISRPIVLWRARPEAGQRLTLPVQAPDLGWLQIIAGRVALLGCNGSCPQTLVAGDGLGLTTGAVQGLRALESGSDLLLFLLR